MMFYASINSSASNSNSNSYKCNNKDIRESKHNVSGSDVDCDCSLLKAANTNSAHDAASALAPKQRSSSYKKYRRAKPLLNDHQHNTGTCNNNNNDAQHLDHSSNSITPITPASAPTTATTPSEDCVDSCASRLRGRHHATLSACCSSAASSSALAVALAASLSICRAFSLSICVLLLLRLAPTVRGLAVGVDTVNANITDLGSPGGYSTKVYSID
ncbi:uncharacterized protein LOC105215339 [Zeugodacus cucurbitae]|uniref:uncharacterized protein LOC105215339 n=1 Tax=Zeugodacus cucurbitae TaxID=28588 RepID=UPI0023D9524E|nr:uncharacterized protein LOC105215339 [Zeugodacus cucurbitae]XP_028898120.2 uncharacterized protein LOC105215339 [Zeugodacus cucurbitae]XP_028898122.2 uncharacterized protein LOC105215339 [Zeugodacus cucurbitae]XP_028898125.2 uncharacterized protein LOC105215339 [Zeugodacus cucurbitae]XP_054082477.1 uncharacterized protein LOC105215339 [Zeugodacus cucurbitae]XP_054082478.1 uncharacterized protein LOC105215339 [Zeugodacus cucurbitae]XP_054082479.1 uncharacterized protein LOC105215339 [Zeugod